MEKRNWREYVREQAENFGIPFDTAWAMFEILGPDEAYDGFITELEDLMLYYEDMELNPNL